MTARAAEHLERVLESGFDRDELAVYADILEAEGDPRGELIAIDLHPTPEAVERRAELEAAWFGTVPPSLRASATSRFGFASLVVTEVAQLLHALVGPISPFVRALALRGSPDLIHEALTLLGQSPRPALDELAIDHHGDIPRAPMIANKVAREVVLATPRLAHLAIDGRNVLRDFEHPHVRTLTISGLDALANLIGDGPPLPAVTSIDFAFHRNALLDHLPAPTDRLVRSLLPASRLPALRTLDLSRNEPGSRGPHHLGGQVDVFGWLRDNDLVALDRLRLPSLRTEQQSADLVAAMQRMPRVKVELARSYNGPVPPAGVSAPPPRPWLPRDQVHGRDALSVDVPGHRYGEDVDLTGAVELMEYAFDTMPPAARDAWSELWDFLSDLGWEDADGNDIVLQFPLAVLAAALEPLELSDHGRWNDLRTLLRQTTGDTVSIKRYWGW